MAELLLELLSEEIPARMQTRAADEMKRLVTDSLKKDGIEFTLAEAYATPRRLTLVVDGLPAKTEGSREEKRGPRADAPQKALDGFRKANSVTLDQCEIRDTDKGKFWFATIEKPGLDTAEVVPLLVETTVFNLVWPKSMRWGNSSLTWVRPLHSILAIFDGRPVKEGIGHGTRDKIAGLIGDIPLAPGERKTSFVDWTLGHRFLAPSEIKVTNFKDYEAKLRKAHVILDPAKRRKTIEDGMAKLAKNNKLTVRDDPALLDEVAGLVEWPVVLLGSIDKDFMDLPPEVLTTAMRSHQKYFSLLKKDGSLAPRFGLVANIETKDGGKQIVAGNERVLRARLSDARFFWDQDRKATLASRTEQLADITFHAKLGTLEEKVDRMYQMADGIAKHVPGAVGDLVEQTVLLAKADLVTGMVGEFPELQGLMGRYYALEDGENEEVADAICDHYAPLGPKDACPSAPVSIAVALVDKIDTLAGFWAINEKPTGSKDPFALRRAALGIIRLIIENKLRLPLTKAFGDSYGWHLSRQQTEIESRVDDADRGVIAIDDVGPGYIVGNKNEVTADLLAFFADRLKVHLRGEGVRHDLIAAVFALGGEDDLVRLLARVAALQDFISSEDGANLLTAYRRAANILRIEEKKDGVAYDDEPDAGGYVQDEESALGRALEAASTAVETDVAEEKFTGAMAALAALRGPVDAFFDAVTVNADDTALRANRLRLLSRIRATMGLIADFSQIEG